MNKITSGGKLAIKMKDGNELDISEFKGYCEEKDLAGRHFSGNCTWEYDLTKEDGVMETYQGIYYMHGHADGDWGTEFSDFSFVSNEELKAHEDKQPRLYSLVVEGSCSDVEGLFIATEAEVEAAIGRTIHCEGTSEVLHEDNIEELSNDQELISKLQTTFKGNTISGYNPIY